MTATAYLSSLMLPGTGQPDRRRRQPDDRCGDRRGRRLQQDRRRQADPRRQQHLRRPHDDQRRHAGAGSGGSINSSSGISIYGGATLNVYLPVSSYRLNQALSMTQTGTAYVNGKTWRDYMADAKRLNVRDSYGLFDPIETYNRATASDRRAAEIEEARKRGIKEGEERARAASPAPRWDTALAAPTW